MALTNSCSHAALEFMHSPPASRSTRVGISQPPSPDTPDAPLGTFGAHMIEWWETEADPLQQEMTWYMDHQCSEVSGKDCSAFKPRQPTHALSTHHSRTMSPISNVIVVRRFYSGALYWRSMKVVEQLAIAQAQKASVEASIKEILQQASSQGLTLEYPQIEHELRQRRARIRNLRCTNIDGPPSWEYCCQAERLGREFSIDPSIMGPVFAKIWTADRI
ncbi:hypothetical protein BKA70DRAFT_1442934 [Coprinopsis sp. MPI-PUGE-AT-0042]|nr:hypothetical protein BKA70DRAFT_1442934 [Coprinopsis sp. MPI-PUGE-AT-0042]